MQKKIWISGCTNKFEKIFSFIYEPRNFAVSLSFSSNESRISNNVESRMAVVISPISEVMFSKSRFRTAIHRRSGVDATKFSISLLSFAIAS